MFGDEMTYSLLAYQRLQCPCSSYFELSTDVVWHWSFDLLSERYRLHSWLSPIGESDWVASRLGRESVKRRDPLVVRDWVYG